MSETITSTAITPGAAHTGVLRGVFVPGGAVGFGPLPPSDVREIAAAHVDLVADRFQMAWSDAMPSSAQMVKFCTVRDWAMDTFVSPAMRSNVPASPVSSGADTEPSIAIAVEEASPEPTAFSLLDFGPEARIGGQLFREGHVVIVPPHSLTNA